MIEQSGGEKIQYNNGKKYEPNKLFDWICKKEGKGIYKCTTFTCIHTLFAKSLVWQDAFFEPVQLRYKLVLM